MCVPPRLLLPYHHRHFWVNFIHGLPFVLFYVYCFCNIINGSPSTTQDQWKLFVGRTGRIDDATTRQDDSNWVPSGNGLKQRLVRNKPEDISISITVPHCYDHEMSQGVSPVIGSSVHYRVGLLTQPEFISKCLDWPNRSLHCWASVIYVPIPCGTCQLGIIKWDKLRMQKDWIMFLL